MTNRTRTAMALLVLAQGLAGCGGSPWAPSPVPQPVPQPVAQPTGLQPTVTSITPNTGSTRGEAWGTITGTQFQSGATVTLGSGGVVYALVQKDGTIFFRTNASAAGRVDVTVTNPGGFSGNLADAYTFAPPETFDFNGDWGGDTDDSKGYFWVEFTIRHNMLVRVSCGGVVLTLPSGSPVHGGEFSFLGDDGAAVSGRLVSPVNAMGTVHVGPCTGVTWWADKSGAVQSSGRR